MRLPTKKSATPDLGASKDASTASTPERAPAQRTKIESCPPNRAANLPNSEQRQNSPLSKPVASAAVPAIQLTDEEEAIAAEFRKLKKMGLPDDAVRHKMTVSDLHPKIIAAVLGEEWTPEPDLKSALEPSPSSGAISKAASESVKPSAVSSATTPRQSGVRLTDEEEATASQYRKMKRMGLPRRRCAPQDGRERSSSQDYCRRVRGGMD